MKMLDLIRKMQNQGIFELRPSANIDLKLSDLTQENLLKNYKKIKYYLSDLSRVLEYEHNVEISNSISDFKDIFSFEMFDIRSTSNDISNGIRQKEISFGKAGTGSFGIDMCYCTFNLEERKLLKLINHYYISLMGKNSFNDDYVFIPLKNLKSIFTDKNNFKCKEKIIDTCNRINSKSIYWDIRNTRYREQFNKELLTGDKERLVTINILYVPKKHKRGNNGESFDIKGIICNVTNFMKLRYELSQISNIFPKENLSLNYLEFIISERLDYRIKMLYKKARGNRTKINNKSLPIFYKCALNKLSDSIYVYSNSCVANRTYLSLIINEPNSKKNIIRFLDSVIIAVKNLSAICSIDSYISLACNKTRFNLFDLNSNCWLSGEDVYNLISSNSKFTRKGYVKSLFQDGDMLLEFKLKMY